MSEANTPYFRITSGDCRDWANAIRDSLQLHDVKLSPSSDLARMLEALDWYADFPDETLQPDAGLDRDHDGALSRFILLEQSRRAARALWHTRAISGRQEHVRRLRKGFDRIASQEYPALRFFFELEVAQRLARHKMFLEFAEPDIAIGSPHVYGLACKRPSSSVSECVRDGSKQIRQRSFPGMLVVNLEALLHASGVPSKPTVTYLLERPEDLLGLQKDLDAHVASADREIIRAFDRGIHGIVFCAYVSGWAKEIKPGFAGPCFRWLRRPLSHPEKYGEAEALDTLLFDPAARRATCDGSQEEGTRQVAVKKV